MFVDFFQSIGLPHGWAWFIGQVSAIVVLTLSLLLMVAYVLLADRKIFAAVQMRKGPNVVGAFGLLQSFADLFKFVFKESIIPAGANKGVFVLAPLVSATLALGAWAVVPLADGWVVADINVGVLYLFAISSLGVYGIIMGGWASNSKYAFLGALRSAAQMVSYEVSIGFVIITVLLYAGSLNLSEIVRAQQDGCSRCSSSSSFRPSRKPIGRPSICRKPSPSSWPATRSNIPRPCSCSSSSPNSSTSS